MMTLANYGIKSSKYKDPISAKSLNKSLQIRNRAESSLRHCLKTFHRVPKDKRNDISEALEEYYSRVPFNVLVWNTNQTKQCVMDTVLMLDYLNPYRARDAFKILEEMLINLIHLPWHKEFTKIFTYSGGFRHNVSDPIVNAESILKAAGFEQESADKPLHLVIHLDRTPRPDSFELITHVIFDCMIAQAIMSDIITVFENCCKASKVASSQVPINEVNCYTWIQHYFEERSNQISDRACSSIQEMLNNITNHLTRFRATSGKSSSSRNERNIDEVASTTKKEASDNQPLRSFMSARSTEELQPFKLSDDLLKIPSYSEHDSRNLLTRREPPSYNESRSINHTDIPYHDEITHERSHRDIDLRQQNHNARSKSRDMIDMVDSHDSKTRSHSSYNSNDFSAPLVGPETFHNDRELLIPKQERKYVTSNQVGVSRQDRGQLNDVRQPYRSPGEASTNSMINQYKINSSNASRSNQDESSRFRNYPSSQISQTGSKSSSMRYDSDTDKRNYEYRDIDRPFSSRIYWSCSSCTFYNHASNESCEMCGSRRPL